VVEDVTNKHLKIKDINALTQNFIVAKALMGFADAGVIQCVQFVEDEENSTIERENQAQASNENSDEEEKYKEDMLKIEHEIESLLQKGDEEFEMVKDIFRDLDCNSFAKVRRRNRVIKDIILLIFKLELSNSHDKLKRNIENVFKISVKNFEELSSYIDALKNSGIEEKGRGMLTILGNSSVGKTSLSKTVQNYCKDKSRDEISFLTGAAGNSCFLETEIVDVIANVEMKARSDFELNIHRFRDRNPHQDCIERGTTDMLVNISDVGGHLAYYFATPLFMKKRGVFAICFNGKEMMKSKEREISADRYQQIIGSYVDLVANNCHCPAIQLVATQMDSEEHQVEELWRNIWKRTADHVKYHSIDREIVLSDHILNTSAKSGSEEHIKEFICSIGTLLKNLEYDKNQGVIPKSWGNLISKFEDRLKVPIAELQEELDNPIYKEVTESEMNLDSDTLEFLQNIERIIKMAVNKEGQQSKHETKNEELDISNDCFFI